LNTQINRLERYTKLLLTSSKEYPEIQEKGKEIIDYIQSINWDYPIACGILYVLWEFACSIYETLGYLFSYSPPPLDSIFLVMWVLFLLPAFVIFAISIQLECEWGPLS
jgi:hypothetical protein